MSIGPFFLLIPMLGRLRTAEGRELEAYIGSFRFAARMAKHAGHVLVASGVLLALIGGYSWLTPWLDATVIVLVASLLFLARAFSPHLLVLTSPSPDQSREDALRRLRRSVWIYLALLLLMLWFMVAKPALW